MQWDQIVDVVIVGSGGAALTAATLAHDGAPRCSCVEKADMLGGTTAVSGRRGLAARQPHDGRSRDRGHPRGRPGLHPARRRGGREPDPELLEVFVDTAPEVLRYLEDHTPLSTHIQPLPDYYWPWNFPGHRAACRGARRGRPVPRRATSSRSGRTASSSAAR